MRVKICGITRSQDAVGAEKAGADAIGLNFASHSKRYVTLDQAQKISEAVGPFIQRVGIFVDSSLDEVRKTARALRLHAVQLHGQESADFAQALRSDYWVIRAVSFSPTLDLEALKAFPADAFLLDGLKPGSGETFDWAAASALRNLPNLILAGGLTPSNVKAAIRALHPYAVDVSSGVEARPGIKDARKVQDFVSASKSSQLSTVIHRVVDNCG